MQQIWQQRVETAQEGITNETKTITAINLARLKEHPMVDAQKEAAKIIEAASNEIVGIIMKEAKDRVNEEQKKAAEQAQQQDSNNTNNVGNDAKTKNPTDLNQVQLMNNLASLVDRHQLLEEDIKGIVVDEQI